jgi:hypothetical protein
MSRDEKDILQSLNQFSVPSIPEYVKRAILDNDWDDDSNEVEDEEEDDDDDSVSDQVRI